MPFTFSHPALILPFRLLPGSWISLTGLVMGSMVPDLEFIISGTRTVSHTWTGILWFDLPLALLAAVIFHSIIRDKLIGHLPPFFYRRFARFAGVNWILYFRRNYPVVIVSVLVGTATHVLWDSFTNVSGYFVLKYQSLRAITTVIGSPLPLYVHVWNLSSVAGLLVVVIALYALPKEPAVRKNNILWFWVAFFLVATLLSCLLLTRLVAWETDMVTVNILRAGLLSLLLVTLCTKRPVKVNYQ